MRQLIHNFLFALMLSTCHMCHTEAPRTDMVAKPEEIDAHVNEQINNQLIPNDTSKPVRICGRYLQTARLLKSIYLKQYPKVCWSHLGKLNTPADTLLSILHAAHDYGLIPGDFHVNLIDSLLKSAQNSKTKKYNAVNLAQADLLLSDALLVFAVQVHKGRLQKDTILPAFHLKDMGKNMDSLFQDVRRKNNYRQCFDSLEPQYLQYRLLKKELAAYRRKWEKNPWDTLPLIEKDTLAFYRALKHRLQQTGDYDSTAKGNDSVKLSKAIKVFQQRNFLDEDGKAGKNTMRVLRMTSIQRIRQIEMNMERWRAEPPLYPKRYVWVNIPQFQLTVIDEDTVYMKSRVVVGLPEKPTPLLSSQIQYIMLYPFWNVPSSIATKEILPILKRDTSYLRKKNFDVLDWHGNIVDPATISWKRYTQKYLPYRFRQREGEDNSLGIMKFNFNNKYGVYLHDTNSKKYFKKDVRAFSHGCMRLEDYMELARYLIRADSVKYPVDSLLTDILREQQKQVNLKKPIPIYTKYFSAVVDDEKGLMLYMDIYRKDEQMERVLYK